MCIHLKLIHHCYLYDKIVNKCIKDVKCSFAIACWRQLGRCNTGLEIKEQVVPWVRRKCSGQDEAVAFDREWEDIMRKETFSGGSIESGSKSGSGSQGICQRTRMRTGTTAGEHGHARRPSFSGRRSYD